jgi:hypothetical protein
MEQGRNERPRRERRTAVVATLVVAALGIGGLVVGSSAKAAVTGYTLRIDDVSVPEGEVATFTVSVAPAPQRSFGKAESVRVSTSTVDVSTSGGDYSQSSVDLTFGPGESSKTVAVQTAEDALLEQNETFAVLLSNASRTCALSGGRCAQVAIVDDRGIGTINDDDAPTPPPPAPPIVRINDVVNATKASDCVLIVALDRTSAALASMTYEASGATDQLAGQTSGTVSFAPGSTTQQIVLDVAKLKRRPGLVTVALSNPSSAVIGDSFGTCTIKPKRR